VQPITQNFGLVGGKLDATEHLRRAIPRLTSGEELRHAAAQLAEVITQPKSGDARLN
jgi:hypothetical protein